MTKRLILLAVLAGCGSDGPMGAPDSGPGGTCTLTLSGDFTGSYPCGVTAGKRDTDSFSALSFVATQRPAGVSQITFALKLAGTLGNKTYSGADLVDAVAGLTTNTSGYAASLGGSPTGTIDPVTVSGVQSLGSSGGVTLYTAHGSASATLVGIGGGGSVRMTVSF